MAGVEKGGQHRRGTLSIWIVRTARFQFDDVTRSAAHSLTILSKPQKVPKDGTR
jgi:hypothetical protein